jgi:hypothetical protein
MPFYFAVQPLSDIVSLGINLGGVMYLCYAVVSKYCEGEVEPARNALGYRACKPCGNEMAKVESKWKESMVIPSNKSTPTYISDVEMLKQLNPKRTT